MRTLTRRELNRALLARQLLLERGRMPIPRALEKGDGGGGADAGKAARGRDAAAGGGRGAAGQAGGAGGRDEDRPRAGAPSGIWERRRADLHAAAEDWLGPPPELDDPAAHLVRRYLAGFGPASCKDVISYTGLADPPLDGLRRFRTEDGEALVDVLRAPLPDPETPAPPRFLPTWDATLLVHARRTGLLPEEHRTRIFSARNPHSFPTFLVDGEVAGTWRFDKRIELEPFGRLDAHDRRALREEADRLAEMHL